MTRILRRVEPGTQVRTSASLEPFSLMRDLFDWEPFRELSRMELRSSERFVPSFDVKETQDAYVLHADLPGVEDKDVDVSLSGGRLTVSGKREATKKDEGESYVTVERSYGTFSRSFGLPEDVDVDQVNAELKQGVLTLTLPKRPEEKPKHVKVKAS